MAAKLTIDKTSHLAVRCAILAKMTLGMPADNILLKDLESAIASFRASGSCATPGEALLLPSWRDEDCRAGGVRRLGDLRAGRRRQR
jgi:hypothetical protein